ncbi:MAG: hemerythrin domain-containing protein [Paracoccaceae bacterium]|jgi:hypothetical protein|nr:hemerythrin domain-containing protein [Paracoccaceae bacterium]MDP7185917.1 hemerythrin domain-containing protein [Paracoccaceae bacterium]
MTQDLTNAALADLVIDPSTRPSADPIPDVTEPQREAGRYLAVIHRHHLMELAKARAVYRHVVEGNDDPSAFQKTLEGMDLVQNYRLFGNLCGRECQMLTFHHDAEEQMVFPQIAAKGSESLKCVVAQLKAEHVVVHELLVRLQQSAERLIQSPTESQFKETAETLTLLENAARSHFGYEETELAEALGVYVEGI